MSTNLRQFESATELRHWLRECRSQRETLGLVPTMGALHAGHLSLVDAARKECDRIVATVFVNPTQFGPHEDLDRYPRTYDEDCRQLDQRQVDAVFAPHTEMVYPAGFSTYVDPPDVGDPWEGVSRPGHFRGVATIVMKLFQWIPADVAFFGEKDFQQVRVIEDMCRDLSVSTTIRRCPTVREPDGLALSSRNRYLSAVERVRALSLADSLKIAQRKAGEGATIASIEEAVHQRLAEAPVDQLDYAAVVDAVSLQPLTEWSSQPARLLVAARIGETRLIDNCELKPSQTPPST